MTFQLSPGLKGREENTVTGIHHEVGAPGATSKPQAGPGAVRVLVVVMLAAGLVHVLLDAGGARCHVLLYCKLCDEVVQKRYSLKIINL